MYTAARTRSYCLSSIYIEADGTAKTSTSRLVLQLLNCANRATDPLFFFFLMNRHPPRSTLFPYTTLSRSLQRIGQGAGDGRHHQAEGQDGRLQQLGPRLGHAEGHHHHGGEHQAQRHGLAAGNAAQALPRSEEHTSELQSRLHLVCRLLLET